MKVSLNITVKEIQEIHEQRAYLPGGDPFHCNIYAEDFIHHLKDMKTPDKHNSKQRMLEEYVKVDVKCGIILNETFQNINENHTQVSMNPNPCLHYIIDDALMGIALFSRLIFDLHFYRMHFLKITNSFQLITDELVKTGEICRNHSGNYQQEKSSIMDIVNSKVNERITSKLQGNTDCIEYAINPLLNKVSAVIDNLLHENAFERLSLNSFFLEVMFLLPEFDKYCVPESFKLRI